MSVASSELISEADLADVEFDTLGIPAIKEETIFASIQDECVQVTALALRKNQEIGRLLGCKFSRVDGTARTAMLGGRALHNKPAPMAAIHSLSLFLASYTDAAVTS